MYLISSTAHKRASQNGMPLFDWSGRRHHVAISASAKRLVRLCSLPPPTAQVVAELAGLSGKTVRQ